MDVKIAGLTIFKKKGEAGSPSSEMNLVEGLGVEGDFHQGGEKQITLLSVETRNWIQAQQKKGLCFARFSENILIDGLPLDEIKPGDGIFVGNAVLRISPQTKPCFDECPLFSGGTPCRLSGRAIFAMVEQSGTIHIGDAVDLKAV
ncbi:MAG: hypothetical protein FWG30_01300 [Eubacteriaceae bacterium]|nr:hypothetical protein [Eubacteriaceae bacterium]